MLKRFFEHLKKPAERFLFLQIISFW